MHLIFSSLLCQSPKGFLYLLTPSLQSRCSSTLKHYFASLIIFFRFCCDILKQKHQFPQYLCLTWLIAFYTYSISNLRKIFYIVIIIHYIFISKCNRSQPIQYSHQRILTAPIPILHFIPIPENSPNFSRYLANCSMSSSALMRISISPMQPLIRLFSNGNGSE